MSYCVNCGVELDSSLNKCPLCGTIVYNPKQYTTADSVQESTFPKRTGEVEKVNRRDSVIFVTILLLYIGSGKTSLFAIYPLLGTILHSFLFYIHRY